MRLPFGPSKKTQEYNQELIDEGLGGLGRIGGPGYTGWGHATPDKLYRLNAEQGWGSLVTRTHELENGTSLGMQFSLPDSDDFFTVDELQDAPDSTRQAVAYVAGEKTDLEHATELTGVHLAGAICPRGDLSDLLWTVTLRVGKGARPLGFKDNEILPDGAEVGEGSGPFITPHNGHMDNASLFYNAHTPQVRGRWIYQIARQMGEPTVSLTFASEHDGAPGMWGREYVVAVAWSLWCGPASKLASAPAASDS